MLVTGAAGGVGTAGVQLAAATGARVVASVRDASKREAVVGLGAEVVVDPDEVADHGPYDVVLELLGAASLPIALGALATGGRVAVIGVGSGAKVELNLLQLMGTRGRISGLHPPHPRPPGQGDGGGGGGRPCSPPTGLERDPGAGLRHLPHG